jgi:hypothetical protein
MQQQACNDTDIAVSAAVSVSALQDARLDGLVYLIRGTVNNTNKIPRHTASFSVCG